MTITTRDPACMSGKERMQEIAAILAGCIKRHENEQQKQLPKATLEKDVTGLYAGRKHSCGYVENQKLGR